jgi:hypothetical protein
MTLNTLRLCGGGAFAALTWPLNVHDVMTQAVRAPIR